jgi:hypothetical protein
VGPERQIVMTQSDPFLLTMDAPPSKPGGPSRFVLYFYVGTPTAATLRALPLGLGTFCMPTYMTDENPAGLKRVTNNIGRVNQLGQSDFPSSPAPSAVLDKPSGIGKTGTIFIQGLVLDAWSPQGQAAITNGIQLELLP